MFAYLQYFPSVSLSIQVLPPLQNRPKQEELVLSLVYFCNVLNILHSSTDHIIL